MRTLPALFVSLLLIVTTTLQADAVEEEKELKMKDKRQLLSQTSVGRKANAGGSDREDLPAAANKGSESPETKVSDDSNGDNDDDDENPSYHSYGNGSGSGTETHHYFVDDRRPPVKH